MIEQERFIHETHDVADDEVGSHHLDPYCECRPEPVSVEREDGHLVAVTLVHRRTGRREELVAAIRMATSPERVEAIQKRIREALEV